MPRDLAKSLGMITEKDLLRDERVVDLEDHGDLEDGVDMDVLVEEVAGGIMVAEDHLLLLLLGERKDSI